MPSADSPTRSARARFIETSRLRLCQEAYTRLFRDRDHLHRLQTAVSHVVDILREATLCTNCQTYPAVYTLHTLPGGPHTTCDACIQFHAQKLDGYDGSWQFCSLCAIPGQWTLRPLDSVHADAAVAIRVLEDAQAPPLMTLPRSTNRFDPHRPSNPPLDRHSFGNESPPPLNGLLPDLSPGTVAPLEDLPGDATDMDDGFE